MAVGRGNFPHLYLSFSLSHRPGRIFYQTPAAAQPLTGQAAGVADR